MSPEEKSTTTQLELVDAYIATDKAELRPTLSLESLVLTLKRSLTLSYWRDEWKPLAIITAVLGAMGNSRTPVVISATMIS